MLRTSQSAWLSIILFLGRIVFSAPYIYGQTDKNPDGSVTDTSGAVLPRTSVVVRNMDTSFTYNAVANEEGSTVSLFERRILRNYVSSSSFKKLVRNNIPIRSTETLRVT